MKTLKFMLLVLGILLILGFVEAFVPWSILETIAEPFGIEGLPTNNSTMSYMMRVMMLSAGLIGVFVLVMAADPKKYKKMVSLVGVVLVILAAYMFFLSASVYEFENLWYYVDPLFALIWGGGILGMIKKV